MISYRYNGVFVQLARTTELSFEMMREPYGVDFINTTYDIRVKGFLSESEGQFPGVNGQTKITATTLNAIKARLESPRGTFEYRIGDVPIVSVPFPPDANLGPYPYPCRITEQGVNSGVWMVECGIKVAVIDCADACAARDPVVSLRWTQTETFDQNWNSNLITDGRVVVRSDLRQNADNFRTQATPPLLNDYIRTVSRYTLDPSGLKLDFHYEDQEVDRLPPFPATKARGTYVVRADFPGFKRVGTVGIHLEGQKGTSRKALLIKAVAMAYSKLQTDQFLQGLDGKPVAPPIIWGRFTEDLFEPIIDIEMSAMMSNIAKGGFVRGAPGKNVFGTAALGALPFAIPGVAGSGPFGAGFNLGADLVGGGGGFNAAAIAAAAAAGIAGAAGGVGAGGGGAPAARGGGAESEAAASVSLIMPSVGQETFGLASGQPGIAPPDRKRIAGLLTALFRDPCLCLEPAGGATLSSSTAPRSNERNGEMLNTDPLSDGGGFDGGGGDFAAPQFQGELRTNASIISVAELSSADPGSGWLADTAPYDDYMIEVTTTMDTGNIQLPGTGVGTDKGISAVVTAHGGMMQMTTVWMASRSGAPPQLPTFESPDPNVVPLWGSVVAKEVTYTPDGAAQTIMVSGYYVHAILDPTKQQVQPPVPAQMDSDFRQAASEGAGFWTNAATWASQGGQGLTLATDSQPLVPGGVTPGEQPVTPPAFDPSLPGLDLSGFSGAELIQIGQTGQLPGQGTSGNHDFYNPPMRP